MFIKPIALLALLLVATAPCLGAEGLSTRPATQPAHTLFDTVDGMKILFVCDATGTMNAVASHARGMLRQAVNELQPEQSFNVLTFSGDKFPALAPGKLLPANDPNKRQAVAWIGKIDPKESTNPIPALQAAFALKPDVLCVLTDGFDQMQQIEAVGREFAKLNAGNEVQVNVILLVSDGKEPQQRMLGMIEDITSNSRGGAKIFRKPEMAGYDYPLSKPAKR